MIDVWSFYIELSPRVIHLIERLLFLRIIYLVVSFYHKLIIEHTLRGDSKWNC